MIRRIACVVGRHNWSSSENRETQGYDFCCRRCGKQRHSYPGDPAFRSRTRTADGDGTVSGISSGGGPG